MARKVSDPLAIAVRKAVGEILECKPYSSARITGGTIHRTSWSVNPMGLRFLRYPNHDDLFVREVKIIDKFVADITAKLAKRNLDMSRVKVGWHFGTGLYLNVRVELQND